MRKYQFLTIVVTILISSQYSVAQPDSIPVTAKSAWGLVSKYVKAKYGSAHLFMLQAGDIISPQNSGVSDTDDTLLFYKGIDVMGYDSLYWKGTAYEWSIICGYDGLSKDSCLLIYVTERNGKPTRFAEYIQPKSGLNLRGALFTPIKDNEWFNSDSILTMIPKSRRSYISSRIPLNFTLMKIDKYRYTKLDTITVWTDIFSSTNIDTWAYYDAKTGEYIYSYVIGNVDETQSGSVDRVYPNPSASSFSLGKEFEYESVQIVNTMGEVVAEWLNTEIGKVFEVDGIPNGVYILRSSCNGRKYSQPLVISR